MLGILNLIVGITVDVIGKEAHGLHITEQTASVRQQFFLNSREEGSVLEIAACVGLEDLQVHMDILKVRVVLESCVGGGTHEIAEVAENKSGHDGIEIDDTDRSAGIIEEDIVDFGYCADGSQ